MYVKVRQILDTSPASADGTHKFQVRIELGFTSNCLIGNVNVPTMSNTTQNSCPYKKFLLAFHNDAKAMSLKMKTDNAE